jgi:RHS repeat-associated protein
LTKLTYPSNTDPSDPASPKKEVGYALDQLDRIDIISSGGKTIADYDYEGKAKITFKKLFNGVMVMKSEFDDGRRAESLSYKSGGKTLFDRAMTWNLMDMKKIETGPGIHKVYDYDNSWRLEKETNNSDQLIDDESEFIIDKNENLEEISSLTNGNQYVSLTCKHENARHQLTIVDYKNEVDGKIIAFHVEPSYDQNGNMKRFVHQYKYDYKNQLREVITGTGLNVEYKYDALGRRIEKTVSAPGGKVVTRYVNAGWRVLEERDEANNLLRRYTYGNGIDEQVAIEYNTKNGIFTFIPMHDTTGNMIGAADDTGKLVEKYSYSSFGMPVFGYDVTPPKTNSMYVGDGIFITNFSEPVKLENLSSVMQIKYEGVELEGTFEAGAGGKEIKFIPSTPLQPGQMSVDIAKTVEDESGNQMENSFSYSFIYSGAITIVHDDSAPEVDRIEKRANDFIVIFSERIDPYTTIDSIKIKKGDGSISGSITFIDERTIKFTPDEMLAANQEYMFWVKSTIKDLSGKSINEFFHSFMVLPDDILVYSKPDPNKHVYSRIGNNYLYHGREYEPEVGLYYYRNRYYIPRIGRFLQPDPMGYEDSMNLYQAFNMNPINFTDPFGNQHQLTVTPKGAEFERPMTVGEFWESLMEAGVGEDEALNIIAENTYYSKYFWDGSLVDRIKTHQMDLTLNDSESRALGMEYNLTLKGPRGQFGRLFRGEFKEFGKVALENLDRQFGDPENLALMFSGGIKFKGAKPYPILNNRGILQWKDPFTGRFVKAPQKGFSKMWGPQIGPGPLGKDVAKTFRSSTYYEILLEEDLILYRVYGGKSGALGSYWTKTRPSGPLQSQLDSAILPEWGNTLQNVVKIRVPKGTKIYEGIAASQKGVKQPFVNLPGGGNQVFIPRVDPKWIIK